MLALNKALKRVNSKHAVIISIWLTFTAVSFVYFTKTKLIEFDELKKLDSISSKQLAEYITKYAYRSVTQDTTRVITPSSGGKSTVIHFNQPNCNCSFVTQNHIKDISALANKNDINVIELTLTADQIIPSTPSIAIIDELGELIYFGPYGEGLACSKTNGFAQTVLRNFLKGYSANLIVKSASGCYCPLAKTRV